jgi:hypothetical protein
MEAVARLVRRTCATRCTMQCQHGNIRECLKAPAARAATAGPEGSPAGAWMAAGLPCVTRPRPGSGSAERPPRRGPLNVLHSRLHGTCSGSNDAPTGRRPAQGSLLVAAACAFHRLPARGAVSASCGARAAERRRAQPLPGKNTRLSPLAAASRSAAGPQAPFIEPDAEEPPADNVGDACTLSRQY